MSKAKKQPSGNWRVQVYAGEKNGKKIQKSFTAPTKAEAEYMAALFRKELKTEKKKAKEPMTVRRAVEKYVEISEVLSPTTLAGYRRVLRTSFPELMELHTDMLTDEIMQTHINMETRRPSRRGGYISAKTIINDYGLIAAALKTVCGLRFEVRLPKKQPKVKYYPEPDIVIDAVRGTNVELPCMLALWLSFSMSEIRGLKFSDVKDGYITINRVKVDVDGVSELKENAKVSTRLRRHALPPYIAQLIEADPFSDDPDAFIVRETSKTIRTRFQKLIKEAGLELTFHDLRHLNASVMLQLGIPEKYAMERGGWKTPSTMKSVYQHTFSSGRIEADKKVNEYFEEKLHFSDGKRWN